MAVSKFPAEGAVLEGGEEGVQFGEVGALRGLLALDGFDDGGEFLLEGKRGKWNFVIPKNFHGYTRHFCARYLNTDPANEAL